MPLHFSVLCLPLPNVVLGKRKACRRTQQPTQRNLAAFWKTPNRNLTTPSEEVCSTFVEHLSRLIAPGKAPEGCPFLACLSART